MRLNSKNRLSQPFMPISRTALSCLLFCPVLYMALHMAVAGSRFSQEGRIQLVGVRLGAPRGSAGTRAGFVGAAAARVPTRLTACAVMANTCYTATVLSRDLSQMGYLQDATQSSFLCATLVNHQDMILRIYRLIQEGLQVCLFHADFLAPSDVHCPFVCCCAPRALPDVQSTTVNSTALLLWQGHRLLAIYALPGCDAMSVLPVGATTMVSGSLSGFDRST